MSVNIMTSLVISYREPGAKASTFLNADEVLKGSEFDRILFVYTNIRNNIFAYEKESTKSIDVLRRLNKSYYDRLCELTSVFPKEESLFISILKTVLSLGIRLLIKYLEAKKRHESTEKIYKEFQENLNRFELSRLAKRVEIDLLPKATSLKTKRLQDPKKELDRLLQNERIKKAFEKVGSLAEVQKIALGHSLELQEALGDKYYIINHGQNGDLMLINLVARKLREAYGPKHYINYEVLRDDVYLQKVAKDKKIDWYKKSVSDDHSFRNELLCGDVYLLSTRNGESALNFFGGCRNIAVGECGTFISSILESILQNYFPDFETRHAMKTRIEQLGARLREHGTLYSICIPKERFSSVAYFSGPFGRASEQLTTEQLERLQRDDMDSAFQYPQVRLLTTELTPENEIAIVPNSTLSAAELENTEAELDLIIKIAEFGLRIKV